MSLIKMFIDAQLKVEQFMKETEGASGIEYAVLAGMVAIVIIGLSSGIRSAISTIFTNITTSLTSTAT